MTAPRDENSRHTITPSQLQTGLRSPSRLPELHPPASTLSLTFTELTPVPTPTCALAKSLSKLRMRSPSLPILSTGPSPNRPSEDLHSKLQDETPRRSKTNTMNSVMRAFSSSKTLHQVLGMRDPEPFATPPQMPHDLCERFEAGLQQYDQLFGAGVFSLNEAEGVQTARSLQKSKTELADILEEKESPVRSTPARSTNPGTSPGLKINVPEWTSGKQAVAVAQRYTFLESDSEAAEDTGSDYTDYDAEDNSSWRYGSSTTLAVSDHSRPGSSTSGNGPSSVSAPSFPPRTTSLLPHNHATISKGPIVLPPRHPKTNVPPPGQLSQPTHPTASAATRLPNKQLNTVTYSSSSTLRRAESLPVLFPSPGVIQRSVCLQQTDSGFAPGEVHGEFKTCHNSYNNTTRNGHLNTASSPVPQITVQAPSPKKAPTTRKRAPSSSAQNGFGPPLPQRARRDGTVGLPVLSIYSEAIWKFEFPGNTNALLTILLTWSQTMWTLHRRLPDPKLFAIHPAFPHPVDPPLARQLISVSFYDTDVEPHREVRFLGPGDVAEMSYHEVDVFNDPESQPNDLATARSSSPIGAIKRTLGFTGSEGVNHIRYTDKSRAKTGEGRWCYILIKGLQTSDGETPPHVILAWHFSAVTATSDCLHTIYPDNATPKPTNQSQSELKRFPSLQNFGAALRKPARFNFSQMLRSASSSSELQTVGASTESEQREGTTLHRTVLKLERAGSIPLVEGFRVDVAAFRGWLGACGKGNGKVIMWREKDGG